MSGKRSKLIRKTVIQALYGEFGQLTKQDRRDIRGNEEFRQIYRARKTRYKDKTLIS